MRPGLRDLERLGTGNGPLDGVLGGGLPAGSVTVLAGEPGTGKTVFALQLMFHLASQGRKCIYFTTLSEPMLKLVRFMQLFSFFDQRLLDERVTLMDLGSVVRTEGLVPALARVKETVASAEPDLVVVDSSRALHDLAADVGELRGAVYDFAVSVAAWGATTLLVGEYTRGDMQLPEFAIADGIIRFSNEPRELTAVRELEVLKLRGTAYVTGRHFFEIDDDGLTFYPRVRGPETTASSAPSPAERLATGVAGLDELLAGGLPRLSTTVVVGATGAGKTLLGLHFLMEGMRTGETGVLLTLEETPDQLRGIAQGFGWDLRSLEQAGALTVHHESPVELSPDAFLNAARQMVSECGARRVVLDSLTSVALGVTSERRFRELIYAMSKHFRSAGATVLMTLETPQLFGAAQVAALGISPATDNMILLQYVEVEGRLERAMSVLKARGVRHRSDLRRLEITDGGMVDAGAFEGMRGVLTGTPSMDGPASRPRRVRGRARRRR